MALHSHNFDGGFYAIPVEAVTLNGIPLDRLQELVPEKPRRWVLIAPSNRAVDDESGQRPYVYDSVEAASEDARRLLAMGECSTTGGGIWQRKTKK